MLGLDLLLVRFRLAVFFQTVTIYGSRGSPLQKPFDLLETDRSVKLDKCSQEVERADWGVQWQVEGASDSLERQDIIRVQLEPIEGALYYWNRIARQKSNVVAGSVASAFGQFQNDTSLDLYFAPTDHLIGDDPYGLKRVVLQEPLPDIAIDVGLERRGYSFGFDAIKMLE